MATLKYKNKDGDYVPLSAYTVNSPLVVQDTGNSTTAVMSQNAVTQVVLNLPDNEDLTLEGNKLKLSDKIYNPDEFSGKGYIILRKNIVDGKNILVQEVINQPNIIYEIRYDFDLNKSEITIPENCILKFEGGSLNNGNIILNNTICISPNINNNSVNIRGNMMDSNGNKINAIYYWTKDPKITFRHNLFYGTNGIEENYKKLKKLGINEFLIFFDIDYETYKPILTIENGKSLKDINDIVTYIAKYNFDIRSFKFHNFPADTAAPYMKNIILDLLSHKEFSLVESIFLINENLSIYESNNYLSYVEVIKEIKDLYPDIDFTFISSGSTTLFYNQGLSLVKLNELGVKGYGINFYPILCIVNNNKGSLDTLISMFDTFIIKYMTSFKTSCLTKNLNNVSEHIYITETGCNDYEDGGLTGGSDTVDKGIINSDNTIVYMNSLLESLKKIKYITAIYGWRCHQWDITTIDKAIIEFSKKNKI